MPSTFSPNLHMELQATGEDAGTWGQNLNNNVFSVLDSSLGNTLQLPLTNVDVTLNTAQTQNNFIDLSGTLTANVNVIFPLIGRTYFVRNRTTGNFTVTLKTTASLAFTVVIPQGTARYVTLDGSDVLSQNGAGWDYLQTLSFNVNSSVLPFLNLGNFQSLRLNGWIAGSNVTTPLGLRVSSNNGVSYDSGPNDYPTQVMTAQGNTVRSASATADAIQISAGTGITVITISNLLITKFNLNSVTQVCADVYGADNNSAIFRTTSGGQRAASVAHNAFCLVSLTGALTAGSLVLEGSRS